MERRTLPARCAAGVAFLLAASAAQPGLAAGAGDFSIPARRAARPPDVDGHVTEREWRGAARAGNFLQFQPQRGAPAELPTVVHVLYDDEFLYARISSLGSRAPAVADDRTRRPDLERRLGADLSGHLPRPADRVLLHGERARDPGRRPHRRGRRHQRRGLGRALALAGAAHRLRLVGRDRDPPDLDPVPGGRRRDLGHQLRPQPAPIAGAHLLGRTGRLLGAAVDGGHAGRTRRPAAVAPPPGDSVRPGAGTGA